MDQNSYQVVLYSSLQQQVYYIGYKCRNMDNMEQIIKQCSQEDDQKQLDLISNRQQLKSNKIDSKYKDAYYKFFEGVNKIKLQQFEESLRKHKISYSLNRFCQEPNIIYLSYSKNFQIVCISISFSYFSFQIAILSHAESPPSLEELQKIGTGASGNILYFHKGDTKFIIKNIKYSYKRQSNFGAQVLDKNFLLSIKPIIMQCCISKLFSALKVGPLFMNPFGFDLVVYEGCTQFCLQYCQVIKPQHKLSSLLPSLRLIHQLHLVHGDIKPENVMWSKRMKRPVFIDFGLFKIVKQNIGQLTLTNFFGSYAYTCNQMKSAFIKKQARHIDVYYNDIHAFYKTQQDILVIVRLKNEQIQKYRQMKLIPSSYFCNFFHNLYLKYLIYQRNFDKIVAFLQQNNIKDVFDETILVFLQMPISSVLYKIFTYFCQSFAINRDHLQVVRKYFECPDTFSSKISNFSNIIQRNEQLPQASQMAAQSQIMHFLKICFNQDITCEGQARKNRLENEIMSKVHQKENLLDINFWAMIVAYIENIHTNKHSILQLFQILKIQLNIEYWQHESRGEKLPLKLRQKTGKNKNFLLYVKAKNIRQAVYNAYGFDLCNLTQSNQKHNISEDVLKKINSQSYFDTIHLIKNIKRNLQEGRIEVQPQIKKPYAQIVSIMTSYNQSQLIDQYLLKLQQYRHKVQEKDKKTGVLYLIEFLLISLPKMKKQNQFGMGQKFCCYLDKYNIVYKSWPYKLLYQRKLFLTLDKQTPFKRTVDMSFNYCFNFYYMSLIIAFQIGLKYIFQNSTSYTVEELTKIVQYINSLLSISSTEIELYTISWLLVKMLQKLSQLLNKENYQYAAKNKHNETVTNLNQSGVVIQKCIVYLTEQLLKIMYFGVEQNQYRVRILITQYLLQFIYDNYNLIIQHSQTLPQVIQTRIVKICYRLQKMAQSSKFVHLTRFIFIRHQFEYLLQICTQEQFCIQFHQISQNEWLDPQIVAYLYCKYNQSLLKYGINPQVYYIKLSRSYQKAGQFFNKIFGQIDLINILHAYYQNQLRISGQSVFVKKCEQIIDLIFEIGQHVTKLSQTEPNTLLFYYRLIRYNFYIFITTNNPARALNYLRNALKRIYSARPVDSKYYKSSKQIKRTCLIPIVQFLFVLVYSPQMYSFYSTFYHQNALFLIKIMLSNLVDCNFFYQRRMMSKYYHIIASLINSGCPIAPKLNKKFTKGSKQLYKKLQNWLLIKKLRSYQYPLTQQQNQKLGRLIKRSFGNNDAIGERSLKISMVKAKVQQKIWRLGQVKWSKVICKIDTSYFYQRTHIYTRIINEQEIKIYL